MKLALISLIITITGLVIAPGLCSSFAKWWSESITFQSLESLTGTGAPVFNEIAFKTTGIEDLWLMHQSPRNMNHPKTTWDRLAIVVDHSKHLAKFYELAPGELAFEPNKAIALKATCIRCHVSGPRAIRPSPELHLDIFTQAKILALNTRIKTYGHLEAVEGQHFASGEPFRSPEPIRARELKLESCRRCHSMTGLRNALHVEQLATIQFMVKNGFMPPFPFTVSQNDRKIIDRFVH